MMSLAPGLLSDDLQRDLKAFLGTHDFIKPYKGYSWQADTWPSGFPQILKLELVLTRGAKTASLGKEEILSVPQSGRLRNTARIRCPAILALPLYEHNGTSKAIEEDVLTPLDVLETETKGLGPTYLTKILRFALPGQFGAIDTRIVRVVGMGDPASKQKDWLSLSVRNDGYGWYISGTQAFWPEDYQKWINILRFLAQSLNNQGRSCPHPEGFLTAGLRTQGIWACADIEMALFSYASGVLPQKRC